MHKGKREWKKNVDWEKNFSDHFYKAQFSPNFTYLVLELRFLRLWYASSYIIQVFTGVLSEYSEDCSKNTCTHVSFLPP